MIGFILIFESGIKFKLVVFIENGCYDRCDCSSSGHSQEKRGRKAEKGTGVTQSKTT